MADSRTEGVLLISTRTGNRSCGETFLRTAIIALLLTRFATAEGGPGENADVEIGGPGSGPGQFLELRDIAFGPDNRLYTLEGRRLDNQSKQWVGNGRVQVFDNEGKFLEQFAVAADGLVAEKTPARIAVSDDGRVFVSEPASGVVLEYQRRGGWQCNRSYPIADAYALALGFDPKIICDLPYHVTYGFAPIEATLTIANPRLSKATLLDINGMATSTPVDLQQAAGKATPTLQKTKSPSK